MTDAPPAARRTLRRKLLLAVTPWIVLLLLVELGFRACGVGAPVSAPPSQPRSEFTTTELSAPDGRKSEYAEGTYVGKKVRLNAKGFRDWLYHEEDQENAVRIAAVGDSFTFGDGLDEDETWLRLLGARLGANAADGRPIRTLNFGRRGANTHEGHGILENHVLPFGPDLVILGFTLFNDAETKVYRDTTRTRHQKREESFLWTAAKWVQANSYFVNAIVKRARRGRNRESMKAHIEKQYAGDAKGWIECQAALEAIARTCESRDVPLVVVIFPSHHRDAALNNWNAYEFMVQHDGIREALAGHPAVPVVDMVDHLGDLSGEVIWIPGNGHPDAVYSARIAEALEPHVKRLLGL